MNYQSDDELEKIKKSIKIEKYILNKYNGKIVYRGKDKSGPFLRIDPCPICGHKGHLDIYYESNTYCSRSDCCKGGSIIDWLMESEGYNLKDAVWKAKEISTILSVKLESEAKELNQTIQIEKKCYNFIELANRLNLNTNKTDYYKSRGLGDQIIKDYKLGYCSNGYNQALEDYPELKNKSMYEHLFKYFIFIIDEYGNIPYFISRRDDKELLNKNLKEDGIPKTLNLKSSFAGGVRILNERYVYKPELSGNNIFITEGWADALSLEELGYSAISLNSTSNVKKLINILLKNKEKLKEKTLIVCGESDYAGKHMNTTLQKELTKNNIKFAILNLPQDLLEVKGINEWLIKDRQAIESFIREYIKKISLRYSETFNHNYDLNHLGNARRIVDTFGQNIRFSYESNTWYIWNNRFWEEDKTNVMERISKKIIEEIKKEANNEEDPQNKKSLLGFAKQCGHISHIRGSIEATKSEKEVAINLNCFDNDKYLMNCLNGTIDLKTGELLPFRRDKFITKMAQVEYKKDCACPTWDKFLIEIMNNDIELIEFIQKAIGYTLTGDISEQCIFILYGTGSNGKSTLLDVIRTMLADYALTIQPETLMKKDKITTTSSDIARLKGARFVIANEIEQDKFINESLVKQITGKERIVARFLYSNEIEFLPEFKVFMGTNYKPSIRGTDPGIWRRIMLIPFAVKIPDEMKDKNLESKLKAELSGILNWAIRGCLEWQKSGFNPPQAVKAAINSYKQEMDIIENFINECCVINSSLITPISILHNTFENWCAEKGETQIHKRTLTRKLDEKGFKQVRTAKERLLKGIGLLS